MGILLNDNQIKKLSLSISTNDVLDYIKKDYNNYLKYLEEELSNNKITKKESKEEIISIEKTDDVSNISTTFYEYEEAKLTKQEYKEYLKELEIIDIQQQRADIDYIMLMTGLTED